MIAAFRRTGNTSLSLGSALVSARLGAGEKEKANRIFSLLTYLALGVGILLSVLGILFLEPIAILMGADSEMLPFCITYGTILLIAPPALTESGIPFLPLRCSLPPLRSASSFI